MSACHGRWTARNRNLVKWMPNLLILEGKIVSRVVAVITFWSQTVPAVVTMVTPGAVKVWMVVALNALWFQWITMKSIKTEFIYKSAMIIIYLMNINSWRPSDAIGRHWSGST